VDPHGFVVRVVAQKGCSDWADKCYSHHLRSVLGAIELTILCVFLCGVRYFDAQIGDTLLYK
jgi:hypothetical protein